MVSTRHVGRLAAGARDQALVPCTPAGSVILVKHALGDDLSGLEAVVVGRSNIVGKPVAQLLLQEKLQPYGRPQPDPRPARGLQAGRHPGRGGRSGGDDQGDWVKRGACVIDVGHQPGS
jgi:methylenetetrahydrofolate dehydrogenase (NADP+)/methenyltetrahydrofolate cyclohydrolase